MKKWLQEFWTNPVKRRSFIIINLIMFAVFFGAFHLLDKQINSWVSLVLVSLALLCEILVFALYVPDQLKEIWQDIKALIAWSNRDAIYHHYHLKHEDKEYKGPDWEDEEFKKIIVLKERVDAFVKASIAYQKVDFERWKKRNVDINLDHSSQTTKRVLVVAIATFISLVILFILSKWLKLDSNTISTLIKDSRSPVLAALITTVITSPVIFVIWLFRDKNNRIQIENARKDTNLKDFQKLSEWASGFHLPEPKKITSAKNSKKKSDNFEEITEETIKTEEDFIAPKGSNSISRRQGAEALQASAIAQLEAFMFGKYGEQFMQPAFLLIHAIWESIITQQQSRYTDEAEFKKLLKQLHKNPIVSALNRALTGAGGNHLRLFESNLKSAKLTGISSTLHSFKPLIINSLVLNNIDFSYADLSHIQLQNTYLVSTNFQGASLVFGNFQKATLNFSNLSRANFKYTRLEYASLVGVDLTDANLRSCHLQSANLSDSLLSQADLTNAQLQGTNLTGVNLEGTIFKGAKINRFTLFFDHEYEDQYWEADEVRELILFHGAIWDDDPNWLVDKIQDKVLLEKIFQDCEKRQKYQN